MCALVTGVQTCALPIFRLVVLPAMVRLADRLRPRLRRVQFHRGALDPPQLRALSRLPDVSGAAPLAAPPHPAAGLGARGGRRLLQLLSLFLLPGTLAAAEQPKNPGHHRLLRRPGADRKS